MKDYLIQFRDQVFNGAMSLYKRIFLSYLILNILVGIISILIIVPLMLKFLGWDFSDLINLQSTMNDINKTIADGGDPTAAFQGLVESLHFEYFIPLTIIGLLVFPWSLNLYFTLNDMEVREQKNNLLTALSRSFSRKVFTLLGFGILYYLLFIASFLIFIFLVVMLMSVSKVLGIIIGFLSFFFVIIFLSRFILGPAAIVHGNMSISQAFGFSYSNLSMKRTALLLLMGIVVLVVMGITAGIAGFVVQAIINVNNSDPKIYFIVSQIISNLIGAITGAFLFAGFSALYFRYSTDEKEEEEGDHLLNT